jgi:hypothetical protein
MRMEHYDTQTFQRCKHLFDYYRERALKKKGHQSLVRKYAGSGVVNFSLDAMSPSTRMAVET